MTTPQQHADILLHHWQNLWPLSPAERIKRINEIDLDIRYEDMLEMVTAEMMIDQPVKYEINPWPLLAGLSLVLWGGIVLAVQLVRHAI